MTLPTKYQNGSIDSSVKGVYRASPVKLMIYGRGEFSEPSHRAALQIGQVQAISYRML